MPRYFLRSVLVVVPCLLLIMATLLLQPMRASFARSASISLSLPYGPPTSSIQVSGKGFKGRETVILFFDTTSVHIVTASITGSFSSTITVPVSAHFGSHFVRAKGKSSRMSAQATFLVQTDWTQFGFDSQHTHFNPYENVLSPLNVANLTIDWSYKSGGPIQSSPSVWNGILYILSNDHKLSAININTHMLLWSDSIGNNTNGYVVSTPTITNGVLYVGCDDAKLYAFNAMTGQLLWSYTTGESIQSSPVVVGGIVYFSSDMLYALDAKTGTFLWSYPIYFGFSSVAIANGTIYVGSYALYALNAKTGTLLWKASTASYTNASPSVSNGVVYDCLSDGTLNAFSATTGKLLWSYAAGGGIDGSPAVANGIVYFGSYDHLFYAVNAITGKLLWSYATGQVISLSSPAIADGVVYIGSEDNKAYAFNATSGALLWSYATGSTISSSPVVLNGVLYIASVDTNLYAFHLPNANP